MMRHSDININIPSVHICLFSFAIVCNTYLVRNQYFCTDKPASKSFAILLIIIIFIEDINFTDK